MFGKLLPGTKAEDEKWIVGEFNCSCVGISKCLAAYCKDDTPNASYDDISAEDKAEALGGRGGVTIWVTVPRGNRPGTNAS